MSKKTQPLHIKRERFEGLFELRYQLQLNRLPSSRIPLEALGERIFGRKGTIRDNEYVYSWIDAEVPELQIDIFRENNGIQATHSVLNPITFLIGCVYTVGGFALLQKVFDLVVADFLPLSLPYDVLVPPPPWTFAAALLVQAGVLVRHRVRAVRRVRTGMARVVAFLKGLLEQEEGKAGEPRGVPAELVPERVELFTRPHVTAMAEIDLRGQDTEQARQRVHAAVETVTNAAALLKESCVGLFWGGERSDAIISITPCSDRRTEIDVRVSLTLSFFLAFIICILGLTALWALVFALAPPPLDRLRVYADNEVFWFGLATVWLLAPVTAWGHLLRKRAKKLRECAQACGQLKDALEKDSHSER